MELQEQVTALTEHNRQLQSVIANLNGEKIALDQTLLESIRSALAARKDVILKDNEIARLNQMIQALNREKEQHLAEIESHVQKRDELQQQPDNS